jgi:hypothetical protein
MDAETRLGRVDLTLRKRPKTEVVAFGKLMAALAILKAKDALVGFQIEIYEDRLADVPINILTLGVQKALDSGGWRPDPGDLKRLCESVRLELRQAMRFANCEQCSADGWAEKVIDGVKRMVRCECWAIHQQKIAQLAGSQPLALPAAQGYESEVA